MAGSAESLIQGSGFNTAISQLAADLSVDGVRAAVALNQAGLLQSEQDLLGKLATLLEIAAGVDPLRVEAARMFILEGPTGVGKSTLVENLQLPVIKEHVEDNVWLAHSANKDSAKNAAFAAQLHFMLGRIEDLLKGLTAAGFWQQPVLVADRFLAGDEGYIFGHLQAGNISQAEFALLNAVREKFAGIIPTNQLTVFLYCADEELAGRIIARGRAFEIADLPLTLASQARTMEALGIQPDDLPADSEVCQLRDDLWIINSTSLVPAQLAEKVTQMLSLIR